MITTKRWFRNQKHFCSDEPRHQKNTKKANSTVGKKADFPVSPVSVFPSIYISLRIPSLIQLPSQPAVHAGVSYLETRPSQTIDCSHAVQSRARFSPAFERAYLAIGRLCRLDRSQLCRKGNIFLSTGIGTGVKFPKSPTSTSLRVTQTNYLTASCDRPPGFPY